LWKVGFEMHCLQRYALKGVASILGAFCPVLIDTAAAVDIFYLVLVEIAAVVASGWREVYRAEAACQMQTHYEARRSTLGQSKAYQLLSARLQNSAGLVSC